eukprot:2327927-Amphidinium_carterae.2
MGGVLLYATAWRTLNMFGQGQQSVEGRTTLQHAEPIWERSPIKTRSLQILGLACSCRFGVVSTLLKFGEHNRRMVDRHESPAFERTRVLSLVLASGSEAALVLRHIRPHYCEDREIVLAAVSRCGRALQYASEQLKGDLEVVVAAVAQNALALQFASETLRADASIVLLVASRNGLALQYVSARFWEDRTSTP